MNNTSKETRVDNTDKITKEDIAVIERIINENIQKEKEAAREKKREETKGARQLLCGSESCDCWDTPETSTGIPSFGGGGGDDWGINPKTGDSGDILFYGLLVLISIFMLVIFNYKPKSYYKKY